MAERAHPDDPGFQHHGWRLRWRRNWIPWISPPRKNPYREALEWRYEWISKHARGQRILDIPCGVGWGTSMIRDASALVGVDLNAEAIEFAQRRYGDMASFQVGSMEQLDFPDCFFDIVACIEGIEHVPVEVGQKFLSEAHRVLRQGGALFLSSPHCRDGGHSGNPYHVHEYQPEEIHGLISQLFVIKETISRPVENLIVHYFRALKT